MASKFRKVSKKTAPSKHPLMGLDRWECKSHGFVVDAIKGTTLAFCPCGRRAMVSERGSEHKEES